MPYLPRRCQERLQQPLHRAYAWLMVLLQQGCAVVQLSQHTSRAVKASLSRKECCAASQKPLYQCRSFAPSCVNYTAYMAVVL